MSVNVARTQDGWWVERNGHLTAIDSAADTTAQLLGDRAAIDRAVKNLESADRVAVSDVELLSPITRPARVVAQMVNYRSHAIDSGFDPDVVQPTFFRKASGSISGPNDDIVCPPHVHFLDYEIELGLVMGQALRVGDRVSAETLPDVVAGVVVTNDVSARDVQLTKGQFYEAKSYPTFTPTGPYLTLLDAVELSTLRDLRLTLSVNGNVRQDHTVEDMITRPAEALTCLARFQELAAGDLVLTGTPGGTALKAPPRIVEMVGALLPAATRFRLFFKGQRKNDAYLQDGDLITATIGNPARGINLGTQITTVRKEAS